MKGGFIRRQGKTVTPPPPLTVKPVFLKPITQFKQKNSPSIPTHTPRADPL